MPAAAIEVVGDVVPLFRIAEFPELDVETVFAPAHRHIFQRIPELIAVPITCHRHLRRQPTAIDA
jgi:hypothetical protein